MPSRDDHGERRIARTDVRWWGFLLVAAALWVALVVYASPDFRGSDQYWYVEDVTTVLNGGPAETHEVYPFSLIGPDRRFDEHRPFIHNSPAIYVWAGGARLLGDVHRGILAVNILCGLVAAGCVYLVVRRFASVQAASLAAAVYLYVPVNFWMTSQDMAEVFSAAMFAVALAFLVRFPQRFAALGLAQALLAVAAFGRLWVAPFLVFVPAASSVLDDARPVSRRLARMAGGLMVGAAVYLVVSRVFVNYMPQLDPMGLLEVSRVSNWVMYYRTGAALPFDAGVFVREFARNAMHGLAVQFSLAPDRAAITRSFPAADVWPSNVLALAIVVGWVVSKGQRARRMVMTLGAAAFLSHVGMAMLYQNLSRYIVPTLPALVAGAGASLDAMQRRARSRMTWVLAALLVIALAIFVAVDVSNARFYRASALDSRAVRAEVGAVVSETIPRDARVVIDSRFMSRWAWDHAVYPRPVLSFASEFPQSEGEYERMLEAFRPDFLIADDTSMLLEMFELRRVASSGTFSVYDLSAADLSTP